MRFNTSHCAITYAAKKSSGLPRPWRWVLCVAYAALVAVLSLAPSRSFENMPSFFPHQDKLAHGLLYAVLAGFALWAATSSSSGTGLVLMVAISATVYGFLLELAQNFLMPGDRFFSFGDAAANAAGAFAVSAAWRFWNWRRQ